MMHAGCDHAIEHACICMYMCVFVCVFVCVSVKKVNVFHFDQSITLKYRVFSHAFNVGG